MNKYRYILPIIMASLLFLQLAQAKKITLTLQGNGQVQAQEADITCTENCILNNTLSLNTLTPTANSGWIFSGWSGQQCDYGSQVLINDNYISIGLDSGGAKTLKTADLNGDNLVDLVSIGLFTGRISLRKNEGNGSFTDAVIDKDLNYPTALDLFDWDGDSDLDLFVAEFGLGIIKVYLNDGLGNFSFSQEITIPGKNPYAFKILDKNNDGQPDIVLSSFTANISGDLFVLVNSITNAKTQWYINQNGNFSEEDLLSSSASMTIDAYEKNGVIAVLTAEITNGEVAQYRSGLRTVVDIGIGTYGAAFGDIDKDGNMDVLTAHYRPSTLNLVYGKSDNSFTAPQLITKPYNGVTATSFGDYNNDGYLDVATGEFNKKVFYYFTTTSYNKCVISSEGDISLTATFIESPPNSIDNTVDSPKNDSSGGSFYFSLLLLSLFCRIARK
jgi:hypothetical protein